MRQAWSGLALVLCIGTVAAQAQPQGLPQADAPVRDAEFGVATRQFALQRRVEMYQWRKAGNGYVAVWSGQALGSNGYDAAHRNPPGFPLRSEQWRAQRITLDGKPLPQGVIDALGVWRDLRPDFSHLPMNLAATFQPEGNGLGSAENPLDPQVGDLRVTWRERVLPPLQGRVRLLNGVWVQAEAITRAAASETIVTDRRRWMSWGLPAAVLLALMSAVAIARRRSGKK